MAKVMFTLVFGALLWTNGGVVNEAHAQQCLPGGFILQSGDQVYCNYSDGTCWTHSPYEIPPDCQARYQQRQQSNNTSNSGSWNTNIPASEKPSSYGAVAWGVKANLLGTSINKPSKKSAIDAALKACGGSSCTVATWYSNQCVSLGAGEVKGGYQWYVSPGLTQKDAEKNLLANCGKKAKNCQVTFSECSLP